MEVVLAGHSFRGKPLEVARRAVAQPPTPDGDDYALSVRRRCHDRHDAGDLAS